MSAGRQKTRFSPLQKYTIEHIVGLSDLSIQQILRKVTSGKICKEIKRKHKKHKKINEIKHGNMYN